MKSFKPKKELSKIMKSLIFFILVFLLIVTFSIFSRVFDIYYNEDIYTEKTKEENFLMSFLTVLKDSYKDTIRLPERTFRKTRNNIKNQCELEKFNIPNLKIYIAPQNMEKINNHVKKSLKNGMIVKTEEDEYNAKIYVNNSEPVDVKIRLKGDMVQHLWSAKRSYKIEVKEKKDSILSKRSFSIVDIKALDGHAELLFLEHLRSKGILAPDFRFVNVVINDENMGIMVFMEHFSKELLESQNKIENVIMGFADYSGWDIYSLNLLPFKVFNENEVLKSPTLLQNYKEAVGLLRGYRAGYIDAEDVFDMEILGKYFALLNLWDTNHGILPHNMRFYYNPMTKLFEPIGYDNQFFHVNKNGKFLYHDFIHVGESQAKSAFDNFYNVLSSDKFFFYYQKAAEELNQEIESGEFFNWKQKVETNILNTLRLEDEKVEIYPNAIFKERVKYLIKNLPKKKQNKKYELDYKDNKFSNNNKGYNHILVSSVEPYKDKAYLTFQNIIGDKDVTIKKVYLVNNSTKIQSEISCPRITIPHRLHIQDFPKCEVPKYPSKKEYYKVIASIKGENKEYQSIAHRYYPMIKELPYLPNSIDFILKKFPFLSYSKKQGLIVKKGEWNVNDIINVPEGIPFTINKGTTLKFAKNKRLILRAPLFINGTKDEPVNLLNKDYYWGGIIVLKAKSKSLIKNANITKIKYPENSYWHVTGAILFYDSPVDIINTTILDIYTEDAINIKNTRFLFDNITIKNVPSDAFDSDFSSGVIKNSRFENMEGDGIDFSGSVIQGYNNIFVNAYDKAISVGEGSFYKGNHEHIKDSGVAIAVKDGSKATLKNSKVENIIETVFMAYIKKTEYPPSLLEVNNIKVNNYKKLATSVYPCKIKINGKYYQNESFDIDALYNGGRMTKKDIK